MKPPPNPVTKTFLDIAVGEHAQFEAVITTELVDEFAKLSGDYNPLHTDEAYAHGTAFGERIAHGMLAGLFFSRLVGMHLPGMHCLYISQSLFFRRPMRIGMEVVVSGNVAHKTESLQTLSLRMCVSEKSSGETLTDGEAIVKMI